jgi:hypothetical protein
MLYLWTGLIDATKTLQKQKYICLHRSAHRMNACLRVCLHFCVHMHLQISVHAGTYEGISCDVSLILRIKVATHV